MQAIKDGYTRFIFISDFAKGTDLYFGEILADPRKESQDLQLEAAIPYRNRLLKPQKSEYPQALLDACINTQISSEDCQPNVYRAYSQAT